MDKQVANNALDWALSQAFDRRADLYDKAMLREEIGGNMDDIHSQIDEVNDFINVYTTLKQNLHSEG